MDTSDWDDHLDPEDRERTMNATRRLLGLPVRPYVAPTPCGSLPVKAAS